MSALAAARCAAAYRLTSGLLGRPGGTGAPAAARAAFNASSQVSGLFRLRNAAKNASRTRRSAVIGGEGFRPRRNGLATRLFAITGASPPRVRSVPLGEHGNKNFMCREDATCRTSRTNMFATDGANVHPAFRNPAPYTRRNFVTLGHEHDGALS